MIYREIQNWWAKFSKGPPAWNGVDFGVKLCSTNYNIVDRAMMIANRPTGDCSFWILVPLVKLCTLNYIKINWRIVIMV